MSNRQVSIPQALKSLSDLRFIPLRRNDKRPMQSGWNLAENQFAHTDSAITEHLKHGGNYGVVPSSSDIVVIDIDSDVFKDWVLRRGFPLTFFVKTHRGTHLYYHVPRSSEWGLKKAPIDSDMNGDIISDHYVVGPGSNHPDGGTYVPSGDITGAAVATIDEKDFLELLRPVLPLNRLHHLFPWCGPLHDTYRRIVRDRDAHQFHGGDGRNRCLMACSYLLNEYGDIEGREACHAMLREVFGSDYSYEQTEKELAHIDPSKCLSGNGFSGRATPTVIRSLNVSPPGEPRKFSNLEIAVCDINDRSEMSIPERMWQQVPKDKYRFCYVRESQQLLVYDEATGVYVDGDVLVGELFKEIAITGNYRRCASNRKEFLELAKEERIVCIKENPWGLPVINHLIQRGCIVVENGVLSVDSGTLMPFDPEAFFTVKLPVAFKPGFTLENEGAPFLTFLRSILRDEKDVETIGEVLGAALLFDGRFQKCVMFIGSGSNGKSKLSEVFIRFFGPENVSHVGLSTMEKEKFGIHAMVNKIMNIADETPSSLTMQNTSMFKSITGQGEVIVEKKHKDPYTVKLPAFNIFSCNTLPPTSDMSTGFYRRFLPIEFPCNFEDREDKDTNILDKVITPDVMSTILNWALGKRAYLSTRNSFTHAPTPEWLSMWWPVRSQPFAAFFDEKLVVSTYAKSYILVDDIFEEYMEWSSKKFGNPNSMSKARIANWFQWKRKVWSNPGIRAELVDIRVNWGGKERLVKKHAITGIEWQKVPKRLANGLGRYDTSVRANDDGDFDFSVDIISYQEEDTLSEDSLHSDIERRLRHKIEGREYGNRFTMHELCHILDVKDSGPVRRAVERLVTAGVLETVVISSTPQPDGPWRIVDSTKESD